LINGRHARQDVAPQPKPLKKAKDANEMLEFISSIEPVEKARTALSTPC